MRKPMKFSSTIASGSLFAALLCLALGCRPDLLVERTAAKPMTAAAMHAAASSPALIQALGVPIVRGKNWSCSVSGNLQDSTQKPDEGQGTCSISFDVSGPNGSAMVNLQSVATKGVWRISALHVTPHGGRSPIDLTAAVVEQTFSNQAPH